MLGNDAQGFIYHIKQLIESLILQQQVSKNIYAHVPAKVLVFSR